MSGLIKRVRDCKFALRGEFISDNVCNICANGVNGPKRNGEMYMVHLKYMPAYILVKNKASRVTRVRGQLERRIPIDPAKPHVIE